MFDKDMLKSILAAYGPSGREQTVSDVIRSYVEPFADEVYNDTLGNLIAVKKGTSGKKVMLSAHMDQIGLIVVDIDEKGFLRVSNVGGVNPVVSLAREVQFENGTHGVTYFETEKHGAKDATMPELFVDIGATTREEAEAKVQIGDVAVYVTNFVEMGSRVSSGALDDRIACAAVVEAFRTMQNRARCLRGVHRAGGSRPARRGCGGLCHRARPEHQSGCDRHGRHAQVRPHERKARRGRNGEGDGFFRHRASGGARVPCGSGR